LLNHGARVTAVGSSDSHTVGNIVGQGRTYVPSETDEPGEINVDRACDAFVQGRTTVSMGILALAEVNGRFRHGDLATVAGGQVTVRLRVQAPSWVRPDRILVYLNGQAVVEKSVPEVAVGRPTDLEVPLELPRVEEDGWLVCVVLGPGVKSPAWATEADYTFAATNPIYLDVDGDGRCSTPRELAEARLKQAGDDPERRWRAVEVASDPVAVQMVSLLRLRMNAKARAELDARIRAAAEARLVFGEFLRYLPKE